MEYKEGFFNSYVNYFISSFIKSYGNMDVFDDTIEIE
jgi:hypothetical protein